MSYRGPARLTTEATAIVAAMTAAPTQARKTAIGRAVRSLQTAGLWSKIALLQDYCTHDTTDFGLDWKTPARAKPTNAGVVTETANQDVATDGQAGSYVDSGVAPSGLSLNTNSVCLAVWSNHGKRSVASHHGSRGGSGNGTRFTVGYNGGTVQGYVNSLITDGAMTATNTVPYGIVAVQRTDDNTQELYTEGALRATDTSAPVQPFPTVNMFLGGFNSLGSVSGPHNAPESFLIVSSALSQAEQAALHSIFLTYMKEIGNYRLPAACWGDSITVGPGSGNSYPELLALLTDPWRSWTNQGVSAESTDEIYARMLADTTYRGYVQILQGGYNNLDAVTSGNKEANKAQVLADFASMVELARNRSGGHFLVLGIHTGTNEGASTVPNDAINEVNAELSSLYGTRFVDIKAAFLANGDGGATDNTAIADDRTPPSLLSDHIHPNAGGAQIMADEIDAALVANGY